MAWEQRAEDLFVTITPGLAWVLCGQPFDVVRVRLAAQAGKYAGAIDCTRQTLSKEGIFALWKGATPALLINVPYSMIMFGVYYFMRPADSGPEARDAAWYAGVFRAGLVAGIPMTLFQNPLDCWRVRCATAGAGVNGIAVLRQTLCTEPPSVLMRGFWITAFRNLPGNGLYFCSYEWALGLFQRRGYLGGRVAGGAEATRSAVVGAFTGSLVTLLLHPTEVVRANMQNTSMRAGGVSAVTRSLVTGSPLGWRVLYSGVTVATCKSVPVNSAGFYCVTAAQNFIDDRRMARRADDPSPDSRPRVGVRRRVTTFTTQP